MNLFYEAYLQLVDQQLGYLSQKNFCTFPMKNQAIMAHVGEGEGRPLSMDWNGMFYFCAMIWQSIVIKIEET